MNQLDLVPLCPHRGELRRVQKIGWLRSRDGQGEVHNSPVLCNLNRGKTELAAGAPPEYPGAELPRELTGG